ncbi:uncharacterized protein [Anabrus simplex]|uniref:uncharacterized protein n=1 Tax=Anabrus simplex TaxID=316456 RepID=UPI0035A36770
MPISEDEFDQHKQQGHVLSKAEQRRSNKPIMEKRRRARINHCLNELKSLILDAMKKDPARHSKLEKADILEMTVKHLQNIQRQQLAVAVATDPAVLHKFKTGFNECAGEVSRYISRMEGVEPGVKQRLIAHLAHCVTGLQQLTPFSFPGVVPPPQPQQPSVTGDVNNNRGLQLIPSRLPSGEFALLLPNGGQIPGIPFLPAPPSQPGLAATTANAASSTTGPSATVTSGSIVDRSHPSAFTAVLTRSMSPTHGKTSTPASLCQPSFPPHNSRNQHSPLLSPTSSVSSCEDGSITSEPYLSSNTPPATSVSSSQVHHQPQTTSVTSLPLVVPVHNVPVVDSTQFKIPLINQSAAFKTFHMDDQKSQHTVSSTTTAPSEHSSLKLVTNPVSNMSGVKGTATVGVGTLTEVKLEFKTIPMTGGSVFPSGVTSSQAVPVTLSSPLQLPLSVVTSQERPAVIKTSNSPTDKHFDHHFASAKDPLDFSIKKEEYPHDFQSSSVQMVKGPGNKRPLPTEYHSGDLISGDHVSSTSSLLICAPPNKVPRFSFHVAMGSDIPHSAAMGQSETSGAGEPLLKCIDSKRYLPSTVQELSHGEPGFKCADNKRYLPSTVQELSHKPSTSVTPAATTAAAATTIPTTLVTVPVTSSTQGASATSAAQKDMWRPW